MLILSKRCVSLKKFDLNLKEYYKDDIDFLFSKKNHLGSDFWTTEDERIGKGSPFSVRDISIILTELGFSEKDPVIQKLAEIVFSKLKSDGRFKIAPSGGIYPCHTIGVFRILCYMGYSSDKRLNSTIDYLLNTQQEDGGWLCNKFVFGKGPETKHSNPGPTLEALDAFRFTKLLNSDERLEKTVDFLLWHWTEKKPIGPCHFGMGSLFYKVEYPFLRYNLFYYVYVLSFYQTAIQDKRFLEALSVLEEKIESNKLIVENPNRQLAHLKFCKKEAPSELATIRFNEIKKRCTTE